MCMITFVPAGIGDPGTDAFASIATRTDDAHWINDDGHGFMIATPEGVWAWKGMSYDTVWGKYERALTIARERFGSVPSAFHSRIGTAGPNDATLCHPFTLGQREPVLLEAAKGSTDALWVNVSTTAMMHNGILPGKYQPGAELPRDSDTSLYVRYFLPRLINPVTGVPGRRAAARIAADIGTGNKFLVFGSVDGKVTVRLINQNSGTWEDDGAWYSSQYYTRRPTWRNGGGYYLGGYNSGYSQYLSKPPLTKRVDNILTRDEAEAAGLRESNAYRGWWHDPDYSYYVQVDDSISTPDDDALAAWLEENAPHGDTGASTERALVVWQGGACTAPKCEGTLGDQNYCRACGRCGDCNSIVSLCSCLTDSAKPDFAWKAGGHVLG